MERILTHLASVEPGKLLARLREAEGVTAGLMVAGENLSVPTHTLLPDAHRRAVEALERLEA